MADGPDFWQIGKIPTRFQNSSIERSFQTLYYGTEGGKLDEAEESDFPHDVIDLYIPLPTGQS